MHMLCNDSYYFLATSFHYNTDIDMCSYKLWIPSIHTNWKLKWPENNYYNLAFLFPAIYIYFFVEYNSSTVKNIFWITSNGQKNASPNPSKQVIM